MVLIRKQLKIKDNTATLMLRMNIYIFTALLDNIGQTIKQDV